MGCEEPIQASVQQWFWPLLHCLWQADYCYETDQNDKGQREKELKKKQKQKIRKKILQRVNSRNKNEREVGGSKKGS